MIKFLIAILLLSSACYASPEPSNKFKLGDGAASNKFVEFNRGAGAANPKFRWNEGTSHLQFANDGSTYSDFGTSVTQNMVSTAAPQRIESAVINTLGATFSVTQKGNWINVGSSSRTNLGVVHIVYQSSIWSDTPNCWFGLDGTSPAPDVMYYSGQTSTEIFITSVTSSSPTNVDTKYTFTCIGTP